MMTPFIAMPTHPIDSEAFRLAELRSERVRILGLLFFIALTAVILTARVFLLHTTLYTEHTGWNIGFAATIAAYE
jgi:hypothetical protein